MKLMLFYQVDDFFEFWIHKFIILDGDANNESDVMLSKQFKLTEDFLLFFFFPLRKKLSLLLSFCVCCLSNQLTEEFLRCEFLELFFTIILAKFYQTVRYSPVRVLAENSVGFGFRIRIPPASYHSLLPSPSSCVYLLFLSTSRATRSYFGPWFTVDFLALFIQQATLDPVSFFVFLYTSTLERTPTLFVDASLLYF